MTSETRTLNFSDLRGRLVGVSVVALIAMEATIAVAYGVGEAGIRATIVGTARVAVVLFLGAFLASAWFRLRPSPLGGWLLRHRRYLGISVAISMTLHLAAIAMLIPMMGPDEGGWVTAIGGGGAYAMMYAMAFTSNDRAVAWMGIGRWRRMHRFGLYYLWVIFTLSYSGRAAQGGLFDVVVFIALLGGLGVRIVAHRRSRS